MTINIGRLYRDEFLKGLDKSRTNGWWPVKENPNLEVGDSIAFLVDKPGKVNPNGEVAPAIFKGSVTSVVPPNDIELTRRLMVPAHYGTWYIIRFTGGFTDAPTT